MAAPLGHTHIQLCNSRLYRAKLRLGCTPRHIAGKTIHIICRLNHARIRHINHMRLNQAPIIGWNQTRIHLGLLARFTGHKRRATKRGSNRQHRSNRCCYQSRFPRQTAKRLRSIRDTRSHPQHSNKRLHKSLSPRSSRPNQNCLPITHHHHFFKSLTADSSLLMRLRHSNT